MISKQLQLPIRWRAVLPYESIRFSPDCIEEELKECLRDAIPINPSNHPPFVVALRKDAEGLPALDPVSERNEPANLFYSHDFVLLTDDIECWIVRIDDIALLEASRNFTLVHFSGSKLLIRRSLGGCERRLDSSIFFRASRGCIVNLSHVIRPRLSEDGGLIFVLRDGKEVPLSRRQTALFRTTRCL